MNDARRKRSDPKRGHGTRREESELSGVDDMENKIYPDRMVSTKGEINQTFHRFTSV